MSILTNGFHPSFDALSAHADRSDVDAARTRVGRHVARCAACAAEVAEIRALGDAARGMELPGAPDGLWARIDGARAAGASPAPARPTPSPESDVYEPAPALRPTRHVPAPARQRLRRAAPWLAAAAVLVALLLYPMDRGARLQAAAAGDVWRFTPSHPAAGSTVSVHFQPAPDRDPKLPTLLLLGGIVQRWDANGVPWSWMRGRLQDSLGVLVRGADGGYAGRFVVADTVQALVLRLTDTAGSVPARVMSPSGPVPRAHEAATLLVTGDAAGRPSLSALTMATDFWAGTERTPYSVADTLVKYYPGEPVGYAARRDMPSHRLLDDVIGWFRSGEREYLKFDKRYMAEPRPSVEHELAMIRFAQRIAEPGELRKWTLRLARDHGDDPRALYMYGGMLVGMFSRANTIDSVRRDLPLADTLWERNGHRAGDAELARVAGTAHDSAAARRWAARAIVSGARDWRGQPEQVDRWLLGDPAVRAQMARWTRARVADGCVLPRGRYPVWFSLSAWRLNCENARAGAYGTLADIALLDGQPRVALALADSGAALLTGRDQCWRTTPARQRGMAKLALGDTAGAAADLAIGAVGTSWQNIAYRDSVGAVLRPAISTASWAALVAGAERNARACLAAERIREQATVDSLRQAAAR